MRESEDAQPEKAGREGGHASEFPWVVTGIVIN